MEIRRAKVEEVSTLNQFLTMLIQDERQYDANIDENFVVTNMYENYIEDQNAILLVSIVDEKIVGYVFGKIEPPNNVVKKREARLDALFVLPEYRNRGIARELVNELVKWAKNNGAASLEVGVITENSKAKDLYLSSGFNTFKEVLQMRF